MLGNYDNNFDGRIDKEEFFKILKTKANETESR